MTVKATYTPPPPPPTPEGTVTLTMPISIARSILTTCWLASADGRYSSEHRETCRLVYLRLCDVTKGVPR